MLNRDAVAADLKSYVERYGGAYAHASNVIHEVWLRVAHDEQVAARVAAGSWPFLVPRWTAGCLGDRVVTKPWTEPYTLFAVDGSQIFPERHQGIPCALINIGTTFFEYGEHSRVIFSSTPTLIAADSEMGFLSETVISAQRTAWELAKGVELGKQYPGIPFFFDGSLIFWHLNESSESENAHFLKEYLAYGEALFQQKTPSVGFISFPKSKELVNVLRIFAELSEEVTRFLTDQDLVADFLKPGERTILFESQARIVSVYPAHLRPFFFYLHTGHEIARVEVPAWVAQDELLVSRLVGLLLDQCEKGRGYPVCLAESHEQAVVRAADRDFFFACMGICLRQQDTPYVMSRKSFLKRTASF
ncbi:MAG: NurA domain-containing protein [candidate division TM6 bacterium GW2011_GWE2_42_60]|nr:MAG: NurA domain-containing protein [candidate division TM6 bacterium GW2011_GWE2_42_60]HBY05972.1 hypothetical protein [Candidatus Dependentiae bacterium]